MSIRSHNCFSVAAESLSCERNQPGVRLLCSRQAGWDSLLLRVFQSSKRVDEFETIASPDQFLVVATEGVYEVECFSGRSWKKAVYTQGIGGLTAALRTNRIRWKPVSPGIFETTHIHLPRGVFDDARDECRRAGTSWEREDPDTLTFSDPAIYSTVISLRKAMLAGVPDLYAASAAQFIARHLLYVEGSSRRLIDDRRNAGTIADRRLARVLEFIEHHFCDRITLDQLAVEAAVSRFHFVKLFRAKVGVTPWRYIISLRMNSAASLLRTSDLAIAEIAYACGYENVGHFTTAFSKQFGRSPSGYRRASQQPISPDSLIDPSFDFPRRQS